MAMPRCSHPASSFGGYVCSHLLEDNQRSAQQVFTGVGLVYHLVCRECRIQHQDIEGELLSVCKECFDQIDDKSDWERPIFGQPEILERNTDLYFTYHTTDIVYDEELIDIQPINGSLQSEWIGLTTGLHIVRINLANKSVVPVLKVDTPEIDRSSPVSLTIADNGELCAVFNTYGSNGVVLNLQTARTTMLLQRGDTYTSRFSIAFFTHNQIPLLVHATEGYNRLDVSNALTGELLTPRTLPSLDVSSPAEHTLHYYHGSLLISPDQNWISDNGWVWHPFGVVMTWNLHHWLQDNVWESEDGDSMKTLCYRAYYWDGPLCWIDNTTLAVWGYGGDDDWLIPAVRIFDVQKGCQLRWFAGPQVDKWKDSVHQPDGGLIFDRYLFSLSTEYGAEVWDVMTGHRLLHDATVHATRYHHGTKEFLYSLSGNRFQISRLQQT